MIGTPHTHPHKIGPVNVSVSTLNVEAFDFRLENLIAKVKVTRSKNAIFLSPMSAVEDMESALSVCVYLSVCERSHAWTIWRRDQKFGGGIDLDNISDESKVKGHGHQVEKGDFWSFWSVKSSYILSWQGIMSWQCHAMMLWRHTMTSFGKRRHDAGGGRQRSGIFIWFWNRVFSIYRSTVMTQWHLYLIPM